MSRDKTYDWLVDLFDVMANERVRLQIEGEIGQVDVVLEIEDRAARGGWRDGGQGGGETLEEAMRDVLRQYKESE